MATWSGEPAEAVDRGQRSAFCGNVGVSGPGPRQLIRVVRRRSRLEGDGQFVPLPTARGSHGTCPTEDCRGIVKFSYDSRSLLRSCEEDRLRQAAGTSVSRRLIEYWKYRSADGFGYHEFLDFCKDDYYLTAADSRVRLVRRRRKKGETCG